MGRRAVARVTVLCSRGREPRAEYHQMATSAPASTSYTLLLYSCGNIQSKVRTNLRSKVMRAEDLLYSPRIEGSQDSRVGYC